MQHSLHDSSSRGENPLFCFRCAVVVDPSPKAEAVEFHAASNAFHFAKDLNTADVRGEGKSHWTEYPYFAQHALEKPC